MTVESASTHGCALRENVLIDASKSVGRARAAHAAADGTLSRASEPGPERGDGDDVDHGVVRLLAAGLRRARVTRLGRSPVARGELPHLRVSKLIKFRRSSLEAWIAAQERKAGAK